MKLRNKNPETQKLILSLKKQGKVWKAVASGINRPQSARYEVPIRRLEQYAQPKDIVAVPGVVISSGEITKPLTVGALKFTEQAKEKITKAGGSCLTLQELASKHSNSKNIRIMG